MLTVQYPALEDALKLASSLEGKVLITCVSGLKPDFEGQTMGLPTHLKVSVAEQIADFAPGAKIVEAFNTTFAELLQSESRQFGSERLSVFYCGDDAAAIVFAAGLIKDCGYEAVDAGSLIKARSIEALATIRVQTAAVPSMFPNVGFKILQR